MAVIVHVIGGAHLGVNGTSQGAHMKPAPISNVPRNSVDTVRISDQAQQMNRFADLQPSRMEQIRRVRTQINEGSYQIDDKLDLAIERLAGDLFSGQG